MFIPTESLRNIRLFDPLLSVSEDSSQGGRMRITPVGGLQASLGLDNYNAPDDRVTHDHNVIKCGKVFLRSSQVTDNRVDAYADVFVTGPKNATSMDPEYGKLSDSISNPCEKVAAALFRSFASAIASGENYGGQVAFGGERLGNLRMESPPQSILQSIIKFGQKDSSHVSKHLKLGYVGTEEAIRNLPSELKDKLQSENGINIYHGPSSSFGEYNMDIVIPYNASLNKYVISETPTL